MDYIPLNMVEHPLARFFNLIREALDDGAKLTKLADETVANRSMAVLRIQSEKLGQVDAFFDKETGLLTKTRKSAPGANQDKAVVVDAILDEYKEIQGGMVPTRIKAYHDGELAVDMTLIDVQFFDKLDVNTFAKP